MSEWELPDDQLPVDDECGEPDYGCDDYPEHDYRVMDERDGIRTLECSRCGAEGTEDIDDER